VSFLICSEFLIFYR